MALPLAWSVGVVVGWGGALCFLLSPFSALALVAPASGGWLGASLSLVVVVVGRSRRNHGGLPAGLDEDH